VILVDTSVWIEHIRSPHTLLLSQLNDGAVLAHPFVIGEVALSHVRSRAAVLRELRDLSAAPVASPEEVLDLIERHRLFGIGIGYVDAHLLASAKLMGGLALWTYDAHLHTAAQKIGLPTGPWR
jgi:predicted nucleic acid-binding protein